MASDPASATAVGGLLVNGVVFGLLLAAPVGPISLLCIRRSLSEGFAVGFAGGVGTAFADGLYALAAATGLAVIAGPWINHWAFAVLGAAMLLWLAWNAWRARPGEAAPGERQGGLVGATISSFALTLANPATILTVAAVLPSLGLTGAEGASGVAALAGGVFLGSIGWWAVLAGAVSAVRHRLSSGVVRMINRGAAIGLAAFALIVVWRAIG
jgi:threonine/homoserine/homoserine lactone efflux protein